MNNLTLQVFCFLFWQPYIIKALQFVFLKIFPVLYSAVGAVFNFWYM